MSYPPQEGFPNPATPPPPPAPLPPPAATPAAPAYETTAAIPTGQFSILPPAAPGYSQALAQMSGSPYGPPRARGRSAVVVLSIATALLVIFGGLMLGLYLNERGNLSDTRADMASQVSEQKTVVAGQQEKLTTEEKETADLKAQLDKLKASTADVTAQRDVLTPCMRHFEAMLDAVSDASFRASYQAAKAACDKAERKMDS